MHIEIDDVIAEDEVLVQATAFDFQKGELYLVRGKNGVGKSFLVHSLFAKCASLGLEAALVEQNNTCLLDKCSVKENIALSNDPKQLEQANVLLDRYGFGYLDRSHASELSGGEQRVVGVLRGAFQSTGADILFLDEPTNDLHPSAVERILRLLEEAKRKIAVVVVTHDERLLAIADKVIYIEGGRARLCGGASGGLDTQDTEEGSSAKSAVGRTDKSEQLAFLARNSNQGLISKFFVLVFAVVTVLGVVCCCTVPLASTETILGSQVDVFVPDSGLVGEFVSSAADADGNALASVETLNLPSNGAMPLASLPALDESRGIAERAALYDQAVRDSVRLPVMYGLNAVAGESISVFSLSYRDPGNGVEYDVMDACEAPYTGEVNTTHFRIAKAGDPLGASVDVPDDVYESARNATAELVGSLGVCTYVSIQCEGRDRPTASLFRDGAFKALEGGSYYVRSKETAETLNSIQEYKTLVRVLRVLATAGIVLLVVDALALYAVLFRSRHRLLVFRDAGLSSRACLRAVVRRYDSMLWYAFACAVACVGAVVVHSALSGGSGWTMPYMCVLALIVFCVVMSLLHRIATRFYIHRIYRWDYRSY